jgi:aspartyl-tRNA(Asn)/glutamyl-tRNA(Gln) amidotransferase subunit B
MFCGCSTSHFLVPPNTQVCPVCLGLPGALPYANGEAIDSTLKFGLALDCEIADFSKFDRKHYFYPDLPKSFQTSQYDLPFCKNGNWKMQSGKSIRIRRIHLEEDTAKLVHEEIDGKKVSLVDFNRSGVPLVELVTEPDFSSVDDVVTFLHEIQRIVRYLGISSADMEKGSMRLEANISLREVNDGKGKNDLPDYKVELKNINSFRFIKKALEAEIERQSVALQKVEKLQQETRGYDEAKGKTYSQRVKEEAEDYRYFPEPDLPPIEIEELKIKNLKLKIPELPEQKREKFKRLGLPPHFIEVLVADRNRAEYFEKAQKLGEKHKIAPKLTADLMVNKNLDNRFETPQEFIIEVLKLNSTSFISESETDEKVNEVIRENEKAVNDYKKGNANVIGYLVGQVQKSAKGKADPKVISKLLSQKLAQ